MKNIKFMGKQTPEYSVEIAPYPASLIEEAVVLKQQYESDKDSSAEADNKLSQSERLFKLYEGIGFLLVSQFIDNIISVEEA